MYFVLGFSIALAAMLLMNSIASLLVSLVWQAIRSGARGWPASSRASVTFAMRILPIAFGGLCVSLLLIPAYFTHEPRTDHEDVSVKLAILTLISAVGISLAIVRGLITWRATSRLTRDWLTSATEFRLPGISIPAYRIDHRFPVIAVVGTFQPRLFVANQVFDALSDDELAAAIGHEAGHLVARDNLKRSFMRACRDMLLLIPCGRHLDDSWKEASESAADEHAVRNEPSVALDLASALVKIARIIPPGTKPATPAAVALLVDDGSITSRVRRLIQIANNPHDSYQSHFSRLPVPLALSLMTVVAALVLSNSNVLTTVHHLIEAGVRILS